jgi:type IV pilus assembly protein PilM
MIGIDISDRTVKVVRLLDGETRRLLGACSYEVPDGVMKRGIIQEPKIMHKVVKETLKRCGVKGAIKDSIVASIPETQSFLRVIEVPDMDDEEMDEAVQWEVAQHIPFGLENVYIDWQRVGKDGHSVKGRQEVLVGAAQKKVIDPLLNLLQGLELDVAALELESQAIIRALISPELRSRQGLLVVDLGGTVTNVVIHDHGAIRFTANLEKGARDLAVVLSAAESKMLSKPRHDDLPHEISKTVKEKLRSVQEELVMEIRGVAEFYSGIDEQHDITGIILTGGGSNFPGMDEVFVRFFDNIHTLRGDPWVNVMPVGENRETPLTLRESVHFSTALGLALREVDA